MKRQSGEPGFLGDFFESPVTLIAMEEERLPIARTSFQRVDLRIHVAIGHKKVQPSVIVHVKESRTPANIGVAGLAHSGGPTDIIESFSSPIQIQRIGLLFKVGNKEAQAPAVVVIAK